MSAAACTVTTASPLPASGARKSWNDGGTPNELTTAAFMLLPSKEMSWQQLAHMMLVQALRLYLSERSHDDVGWFAALADPQLSVALGAIHADPAYPWTLQELAARAGMSRSIFTERFRERVNSRGLPRTRSVVNRASAPRKSPTRPALTWRFCARWSARRGGACGAGSLFLCRCSRIFFDGACHPLRAAEYLSSERRMHAGGSTMESCSAPQPGGS
ncbi:uncharacterized protein SOCE26_002380 [Sorangium cellulosum]|uniref:HTH araC/xylS-type domain-containing protein n=1 Tax=Sorangium cellulosum TaxID=56 RepID=A0A2L0EHS3_SORCE|nr:uncharacterized protein SOCE26_002380 [Sorangium cellulosum]